MKTQAKQEQEAADYNRDIAPGTVCFMVPEVLGNPHTLYIAYDFDKLVAEAYSDADKVDSLMRWSRDALPGDTFRVTGGYIVCTRKV